MFSSMGLLTKMISPQSQESIIIWEYSVCQTSPSWKLLLLFSSTQPLEDEQGSAFLVLVPSPMPNQIWGFILKKSPLPNSRRVSLLHFHVKRKLLSTAFQYLASLFDSKHKGDGDLSPSIFLHLVCSTVFVLFQMRVPLTLAR